MAFCTECGTNVPDNVKFCTGCGKPMDVAMATAPAMIAPAQTVPAKPEAAQALPQQVAQSSNYPVNQAGAGDAAPPKDSPYAVISTGGYMGIMLLFMIPVVGWLACAIMAFVSKNRNRRNFARAMLIFLVIGIVLSVALYFLFSWMWEVVQEYIRQYISEATGDLNPEFEGLSGLLEILNSTNMNELINGNQ